MAHCSPDKFRSLEPHGSLEVLLINGAGQFQRAAAIYGFTDGYDSGGLVKSAIHFSSEVL